jgi:hypothetical protein
MQGRSLEEEKSVEKQMKTKPIIRKVRNVIPMIVLKILLARHSGTCLQGRMR